MSVLIKDMEMPKNCAYCPLSKYRNTSLGQILDCKRIGTVGTALRDTHDVLNRRHPNCPLIDISTPHGRLGDLDELYKVANMADDFGADTLDMLKLIADTPTVIEAEGET